MRFFIQGTVNSGPTFYLCYNPSSGDPHFINPPDFDRIVWSGWLRAKVIAHLYQHTVFGDFQDEMTYSVEPESNLILHRVMTS